MFLFWGCLWLGLSLNQCLLSFELFLELPCVFLACYWVLEFGDVLCLRFWLKSNFDFYVWDKLGLGLCYVLCFRLGFLGKCLMSVFWDLDVDSLMLRFVFDVWLIFCCLVFGFCVGFLTRDLIFLIIGVVILWLEFYFYVWIYVRVSDSIF